MNNPCKECLVTAICNEGCYRLEAFLDENLKGASRIKHFTTLKVLADYIRQEKLYLYDNDTRWGSHPYET